MSIPEMIDGLPAISGFESEVVSAGPRQPVFLPESRTRFGEIKSAFAVALHMQQPMIPAGGGDLGTAALVSNLKHMMDNQHIGDNHNASVFHWCYKRMGDLIPQLVGEGKEPRVMLGYSGCLLHGLRLMGLGDVIDNLRKFAILGRRRHKHENGYVVAEVTDIFCGYSGPPQLFS